MRTTAILAVVAIIAAVGAVAAAQFAIMVTPAHAQAIFDPDDAGHGKSYHDRNGDTHSGGKA